MNGNMKYLVYARKSSESEDRQVLSISAQESELKAISEREGYETAASYQESMSAKASGRPVFNEMLKALEKGKGYSLLVWNVDRLARNMVDGGMILELMDKRKIIEIRTYEKTYRNTPDDKFMMSLSFGIAKKYVDDLSVNVKRGNRAKLERGEWPNHAPFGYLNDKNTKSVVVDPDRSRYVPEIYKLYASGGYSLKDISDHCYRNGLRTRSGKKVLKSQIQRILSSSFYTGVMVRDGKCYQGNHEPLVSKKLFDEAQEVMNGVSRPRRKSNTLFFPLRGYVRCEACGCAFTASLKKGHQYYYCTNGRRVCEAHRRYMREDDLYEIVGGFLGSLVLSERKIELMYQAAKEKIQHTGSDIEQNLAVLDRRLRALSERESRLLDAFIGEQIDKELYDQKAAQIEHEKIDIKNQMKKLETANGSFTLEPTKKVFLEANRSRNEFLAADDEQKRMIAEKLLWNFSMQDGKVAQVRFKTPYDIISKMPKTGSISMLLRVRDSNPNTILQRDVSYH